MPGWENLDLDPVEGAKYWKAPWLEYEDDSVDYIYSEHFIEHLEHYQFSLLLTQSFGCLKPGGKMRLSTPDLMTIINDYKSDAWIKKYSQVGFNPSSAAKFVNEAMRSWGHQFIYDFSELLTIGKRAGFSSIKEWPYNMGSCNELDGLETRPFYRDLIVEFTK